MQGLPLLAAILLWIFGHGVWATIGMVATVIITGWALFAILIVLGVFGFVASRAR